MLRTVKSRETATSMSRLVDRVRHGARATESSRAPGPPSVKMPNEFAKNRTYYLMMLPALIVVILFSYAPLPGIILAFKNYDFSKGIFGSPWNGLRNFRFFFNTDNWSRTTFNTVWINFNNTLWETVIAVSFAIFLNEIRKPFFKRVFQVLIFLPYFFSAVIIGRFVYMFFNVDYGIVNQLITLFGGMPVAWYMEPQHWVKILVTASVWKYAGYSVIIYLATLASIDAELFEAANMDGANRFQQIGRILLPLMVPTIIILNLLSIGRFFFGNFQLIYAVTGNYGLLLPTTDIIETFIYRSVKGSGGLGGGGGDFGQLTAVGLYQSVVGMILVLGSNLLVRRYNPDAALF
jgi:putative aldouronate transport system permease protein